MAREKGATAKALIAAMRGLDDGLAGGSGEDLGAIRKALAQGIDALSEATDWVVDTYPQDPQAVAAGAVPYLRLLGVVAGGWLMARAALAAENGLALGKECVEDNGGENGAGEDFLTGKVVSARFYADQILVQAEALAATVTQGWVAVARFPGANE